MSFLRNNLTVFDLVLLKGFGAKELLRVGGKLPGPGASLRFNVPQSTLMECRDGETEHTDQQLVKCFSTSTHAVCSYLPSYA